MSRLRAVRILVLLGGVAIAVPAHAHRLDEYLQATRLDIDVDRIGVEIGLTPGANIATQILALIDTNRDGSISDSERRRYAREVIESLSVSLDGRPARLTLDGYEFPEGEDMTTGRGVIRLRAVTNVASGAGRHQLVYANAHAPASSVYLVNALLPSDERVQIAGQRRDREQRGMTLDYRVSLDVRWMQAGWLLTAVAILGSLAVARRLPARCTTG
jgi:hypothetical protein